MSRIGRAAVRSRRSQVRHSWREVFGSDRPSEPKELRDAYEQHYRAKIDWNEVARKDRAISQLISEIFQVPQDLKQENLRGPGRK